MGTTAQARHVPHFVAGALGGAGGGAAGALLTAAAAASFELELGGRRQWLAGIAPTGKHVKVPLVAIVNFRDGKVAHEHIYWDQASVLVQIGLLDAAKLPIGGVATAAKAIDPQLPSNLLIKRSGTR